MPLEHRAPLEAVAVGKVVHSAELMADLVVGWVEEMEAEATEAGATAPQVPSAPDRHCLASQQPSGSDSYHCLAESH